MSRKPGWIILALVVLGFLWFSLPFPLFNAPLSRILLDERGDLLSGITATDGQWRFPNQGQIPDKFLMALSSFEDKHFSSHFGLDPLALIRAVGANLLQGETVSGASTLSMQVIRLALKNPQRGLGTKLWETLLALRLELSFSKNEILSMFAENAPFGGNVVGLTAASWRYFYRPPGQLSWGEAALLAILPNAPGLLHPGRNTGDLKIKRDRLLQKLQDQGTITGEQRILAQEEPLPQKPYPLPLQAPHLLFSSLGDNRQGNTTLSSELQTSVQTLTDRHVKKLEGNRIFNAAVLVMETSTGAVKAYVGNRSPDPRPGVSSSVDLIGARRSTGSLFKPLLYAQMLQSGELLPTQLVLDVPTRLGDFKPENHKKGYDGMVRASQALARSLNIPAVRELRDFGVDRFYNSLLQMGITLTQGASHYGLSLIIGGAESTLWELTSLFAGLGRTSLGGEFSDLGAFFPGTILPDEKKDPFPQKIDRSAAWLTLEALSTLKRPGEEGPWENYTSSRKIAWKTGTSQGYRDAWAIGVTPEYTVGVWVGNATGEGRPELLGALAAAPLLFQVFGILPGNSWFPKPWGDLRSQDICLDSGYPAGPECGNRGTQEVPRVSTVVKTCPFCRTIHLDKSEKYQANGDSLPLDQLVSRSWFILQPVAEYYYRKGHPEYRPLPPSLPGKKSQDPAPFSLIFPEEGSQIYIPVEMDGSSGQVVFSAAHRDPSAPVYWHLDGQYRGITRETHQLALRPGKGPHSLTITDNSGKTIKRNFLVLSD